MSTPSPIRSPTYRFDQFELDLGAFSLRNVAQGNADVNLEPQVLQLLAYLVQHNDTVVTRDELLDELWGHRFVSSSAVATQIKSLRRALGDDGRNQRIIRTVHGRGYRFVADVTDAAVATDVSAEPAPSPAAERISNLGFERTKLIGREQALQRVMNAFDTYRLVTLLGIGGVGKTRLAKAIGRGALDRYPDGVWFIDLVPVKDGPGIDTAIASALGISVQAGQARAQIAAALRDARVLLILDSCAHIEDDVAAALDYLLENTAAPTYLATSRDPIDLADELRFFIDPLPVFDDTTDTPPAVELFVQTAERHGMSGITWDLPRAQRICAHLDGLPLAIELAAAQLKQLTIDELEQRLDRRFELLAGRQRDGVHRQDSLHDVLEDTWQLLNDDEQRLLGQLAVFPGQFTVTDIEEVFADELAGGISFSMSRLVELCLLSRTSRSGAWWRLLETVRLFALDKLAAAAREDNAERHAEWVLERLGAYPEDQLHSFRQARWSADHYADLTAAERYFEAAGRFRAALDVCCGVGLMIQLDDGARAAAKLERIRHYLDVCDDTYEQSKLHGTAALCAQATRNPELLETEADLNLQLCREVDDPQRITGALILSSLTRNFSDPELARALLDEAVQVADTLGHEPTRQLVTVYRAWSSAVTGNVADAASLARPLAHGLADRDRPLDNLTYNGACVLIACEIFDDPASARRWTEQLLAHEDAHRLWGATILYASAFAASGSVRDVAQLVDNVGVRLRRAGRSLFPDVLIPAIVLARSIGEPALAQRWLTAIRHSRKPQQSFHSIAVYRQLRRLTGGELDAAVDLDDAGAEALAWLRAQADQSAD